MILFLLPNRLNKDLSMTTLSTQAPSSHEESLNSSSPFKDVLQRIRSKQLTVGIVGLGYVGLPLAMAFADTNVKTIGFDIDQKKISDVTSGINYFSHLSTERLEKVSSNKTLTATCDFSQAHNCDALIICVPTPLTKHLEPDLSYIESTCKALAPHLKENAIVCLESTSWPGTTEEVLQPILEQGSGLISGENLHLAFSPEREDPGNPSYHTQNIPKLVGATTKDSLLLATELYKLCIENVVPVPGTKVAESAKLLENIFRSVNIALINEIKIILDKMNVDVWDVIEAASTKPFGFMPFWPGPGLGGHCIPIDPYYLSWKAKEYGINTRFIELAGEINRSMPSWVISKVQDCLNSHEKPLKNSKVLVLGMAYKPNVSDLRESPSLKLISLLKEKGSRVEYNDPFIPNMHRTREYPDLENMTSQDPSCDFDCFILSTAHKEYDQQQLLSYGVPIIDTRRHFEKHDLVYRA